MIVGTIVNVASFGLFVELVPRGASFGALDGLLLFDRTPYQEIARLYRVGQELEVVVRDVDANKEIVRLEMLPDPTHYAGFWPQQEKSCANPGAAPDADRMQVFPDRSKPER